MVHLKNFSIKDKNTKKFLVQNLELNFPDGLFYIQSESSDKIFEILFATILGIQDKIYSNYEITYDQLEHANENNSLYRLNVGVAYTQLSGIYQTVYDEIRFFSKDIDVNQLKIENLEQRDIYNLSGGELQKVILSRTLYSEPNTMFLHNQFAELDKSNKELVLGIIRELRINGIVYDTLENKYYKYFDDAFRFDLENNRFISIKKEQNTTSQETLNKKTDQKIDTKIKIENLSFGYGKEFNLFEKLYLSFVSGLNFLLGENGSGKTTLFKILTGILSKKKYDGKVVIDGEDLEHYLNKHSIGISFQNPELSLFNVTANKELKNIDTEKGTIADKAITLFGLENKLDKELSHIDFNEKKKLTLIQVLKNNPEILLFDEPTQNFSNKEKSEVVEYFNLLLQKGKTLIVITHSEDFLRLFKNPAVHLI